MNTFPAADAGDSRLDRVTLKRVVHLTSSHPFSRAPAFSSVIIQDTTRPA